METLRTTEMPTERLRERLLELQELAEIPRAGERKRQIDHEMACIAFDLLMRERDGTGA